MTTVPLAVRLSRRASGIRRFRGGLKLAIAAVPKYPGRRITVTNHGIRFECDMTNYLEWNLAALCGYEEREKAAFLSLVPLDRRTLILDIGANVGSHSLPFAKAFDRVVAFDPNPITYGKLLNNLALNPGLAVEPHNIGLGDSEGMLRFYQPKPGYENQGSGTFDPSFAPASYNAIDLPVMRGDDFLAGAGTGRVDAIKMDVQGFEPQVIRGLRATIERDRPIVWLEISDATISEIEASGGLSNLMPANYGLKRFTAVRAFGLLHRTEVETIPEYAPRREGNYLLVPEEWR